MTLIKSIPMFIFMVGFVLQIYARPDIEKAIEQLEQQITKIQKTVDESGNADAVDMLNKAKESLQKTSDLTDADDKKGAWRELHNAHRYFKKAYFLARGSKKFKGNKGPRDPAEMAAKKIERMQKYIESATKIVEESGNEKAKEELASGIEHIEKAKGFIADGKTEEAMSALRQASKSINYAVKIAKQPGMVERMIKHLEKALEKIQESVNNSENQKAKDLLAEGIDQFEKGKQLYQAGGDINQAKETLRIASKSIYKAMWMVKSQKSKHPKKKQSNIIEKWIERVTKQIEKAKEAIEESDSDEAKAKIAEAVLHLDKAMELKSQEDKNKEAMDELKRASKLIHEAYMIVKLPVKVEKWIGHLEKRAEKVRELVEKSEDSKVKETFNEGVALLTNAKELLAAGKSKEAIADLKKATRQIHKAMRMANLKMKMPDKVNP